MFRGNSIKLARILGIRIGVSPSWFVVLFLAIYWLSTSYGDQFPNRGAVPFVLAVATALLFFLSIVLHELGHAVVAMRNGIKIEGIDLWLLGGVAKLSRDSKSAGEEFRIAAAGPFVTLLIAVICAAVGWAVGGSAGGLGSGVNGVSGDELRTVVDYLFLVNLSLFVFNLVPAFPLDGGRIARSIAWAITGSRTKATRFAARTGQLMSYVMIGLGGYLLLFGNDLFGGLWLAMIGTFVGQSAKAAQQQSDVSSRIDGMLVSDVMDAEPVAIPAGMTLDRAEEEFFLRYGYPWFPVVDDSGRYVGLVIRASIEGLPEAVRAGRTVASVMAEDTDDRENRLRVGTDEPLESLLALDGLARLGAIMAVDGEGRLRGIVTVDEVRRALSAGVSHAAGASG